MVSLDFGQRLSSGAYKIQSYGLCGNVFLLLNFIPETIYHVFVFASAGDQRYRHSNVVGIVYLEERWVDKGHGAEEIIFSALDKILRTPTEAICLK
jgi:hypothetical protein